MLLPSFKRWLTPCSPYLCHRVDAVLVVSSGKMDADQPHQSCPPLAVGGAGVRQQVVVSCSHDPRIRISFTLGLGRLLHAQEPGGGLSHRLLPGSNIPGISSTFMLGDVDF